MNRPTATGRRGRIALIAAAIAFGALSAPNAAGSAFAAGEASVPSTPVMTDAASAAVLHVGVRQAGVGDPIPVTVVGGASGDVWEIVLVSPETTLGSLTVGADGTGTTLVSLPIDSDPGAADIIARSGGDVISTGLSSAGDAAQEAETTAAEVPEAAEDSAIAVGPAVVPAIGIVAGSALAAASVVAVVVLARRRSAR
ncbi:hypothetical protein [Microbacterium sp. SSM24]|uniref:hypothetical protein n=1 Tax=Microbacterium sp. SSM24 TaxID=2991714 RepID=UPI0022278789|nr:hypothetical protein [Microbacterium sp. SSM24]MCW3491876.1 hypothetical protein [Microbacterium sp. SSM24]